MKVKALFEGLPIEIDSFLHFIEFKIEFCNLLFPTFNTFFW